MLPKLGHNTKIKKRKKRGNSLPLKGGAQPANRWLAAEHGSCTRSSPGDPNPAYSGGKQTWMVYPDSLVLFCKLTYLSLCVQFFWQAGYLQLR
jgi:hypothetical protein